MVKVPEQSVSNPARFAKHLTSKGNDMPIDVTAAEIERLRETVALMEKRIIQLQGHDAVYCQDLKPYGPSDKGTTE